MSARDARPRAKMDLVREVCIKMAFSPEGSDTEIPRDFDLQQVYKNRKEGTEKLEP